MPLYGATALHITYSDNPYAKGSVDMERRGFFIFGDVLACTTAGAAAGWLSWLAVPADWITPFWIGIGLILGMALGMIAGMTCGLLFMPFFGALEIVGSMLHPLPGVGAAEALSGGAVIGITCLTYTYALQARIGGDAT